MYDFRIDQPAFVQALNEYENYIRLLGERQSDLEQIKNNMARSCTGLATAKNIELYRKQLTEGNFAVACKNMDSLRGIMEETLHEINALLVRCEDFPKKITLKDQYAMMRPAVGDNRVRNGGILSLNYEKTLQIYAKCDLIERAAQGIRNDLVAIVNNLNGELTNSGELQTKINSAYGKINGISHLKSAIERYEKDIKQLECEFAIRMTALARDVEYARKVSGITREEARSGIYNPNDPFDYNDTVEGKIEYARHSILNKEDEQIMEMANEIFAKDISEWKNEDFEIIAQTFDYAIEEQKISVIELFVKELYVEQIDNFRKEATSYAHGERFASYSYDYKIEPNTELISELMSRLDVTKQGKAYYTLNRLSEFKAQNHMRNPGDMPSLEDIKSHFEISVENVDGKMMLLVSETSGEKGEYEISIENVGLVANNYLSNDTCFTEEMVDSLCLGVKNENDLQFMSLFVAGNYKEAVKIYPDNLSDPMKRQISNVMSEMIGSSNDRQFEEVEEFINSIYAVGSEYGRRSDYSATKWLETMALYAGSQCDVYTATLLAGGVEIEGAEKTYSDLAEASSLWNALYLETIHLLQKNVCAYGNAYTAGTGFIKVDGLAYGEDKREINLIYEETTEAGVIIEKIPIKAHVYYDTNEAKIKQTYQEAMKLQAQMNDLTEEFLADATFQVIQDVTKIPIKKISDCAKDFTPSKAAKPGMDITGIKNDTVTGAVNFVAVIESYYKKKKELEKKLADCNEEIFYEFFGSCIAYEAEIPNDPLNGSRNSCAPMGIYNYEYIEKGYWWSLEGISYLLLNPDKYEKVQEWNQQELEDNKVHISDTLWNIVKNEGLPKTEEYESNKELKERLERTEEARTAAMYLIYGNKAAQKEGYNGDYQSVLDIPPDVYADAITLIDQGLDARDFQDEYKKLTGEEGKISLVTLWNGAIYE